MNNQIFLEIKKAIEDINSKSLSDEVKSKIILAHNRLELYSNTARTEGILMMDEMAEVLPDEGCDGCFRYLITLVSDCIELETLEECGLLKYYQGCYKNEDAFICLMYLRCISLIQQGEYLKMARVLDALMPEVVRMQLEEINKAEKLSPEEELDMRVKQLVNEEKDLCKWPYMEQLSSILNKLSGDDISIIVQNPHIKFKNLAVAIKFMPGKTRKRIFDNLPSKKFLKNLIFEMEIMGPIRERDIEENSRQFLEQIEWLMEINEISRTEYESLKIILE